MSPKDPAHPRVQKLEGFKQKGENIRDLRANVNSPSYVLVYLSVHVSMHLAVQVYVGASRVVCAYVCMHLACIPMSLDVCLCISMFVCA